MPLTGSGSVLAAARKAARKAVQAKWLALARPLSPAEIEQMQDEMDEAVAAVDVTHTVTNAVVVVVGGGGTIT